MRVVFTSAGLLGLANVVVYAIAGPGIIALLTGIPEVRAAAGAYLLWPMLLPLVAVWAYTYDGVYLAATRTAIMRNTVVAAFMAFLLLLYTLLPVYGNTGLWIALTVYLGLGVFTANFVIRERYWSAGPVSGWSMGRRGYLPMSVYGYALACFARERCEDNPDWARELRLDVRTAFNQTMKFFEKEAGRMPQ